MPRRITRNHRRRRAHRASRSTRSHATSVVVRGGPGQVMPDRTFTKLRWSKAFQLIGGTSTYAQFSQNGIFDIDPVVGSQQPMGFDQYMAMYSKFKVHKSTIKIRCLNIAAQPCMLLLYPVLDVLSTPSSLEQDLEQRYSKQTSITSVNAGGKAMLVNSLLVKKFNGGLSKLDSTFEGTQLANPVVENYWNIVCYSADGVTAHNVQIAVEIDYHVEFFGPDRLPISSA